MIIHLDMDAFYASVEIREQPDLAGRPVVVGGSPQGRGVVAAANYEARKYGVRSALPMAIALKRCPALVVLPVRMAAYAEESRRIFDIVARYTPAIEPLSLDEAFIDARASEKLFGTVPVIARRIKDEIRAERGLAASIGIAPVKFAAKIASDLGKPDGFLVVESDDLRAFLDPLPVSRLWGVGKVGEQAMHRLGLRTVADVAAQDERFMDEHFGKHGLHLLALARGIDPRQVVSAQAVKSVSNETTFPVDVSDRDELRGVLLQLTEQVAWRLRDKGLKGRTVQLKARYADFSTYTRAFTLEAPTDATDVLWRAVAPLLDRLPRPGAALRLIGMGVSGFDGAVRTGQGDMFSVPAEPAPPVDAVADRIKQRFGSAAVARAATMRKTRR